MATADQTHRDPLQTVYHRHPCKRMVHTSVSIYSARPTPPPKSNQVDKYVGDLSLWERLSHRASDDTYALPSSFAAGASVDLQSYETLPTLITCPPVWSPMVWGFVKLGCGTVGTRGHQHRHHLSLHGLPGMDFTPLGCWQVREGEVGRLFERTWTWMDVEV